MSAVAARPLLRSSARFSARRFQSTTTQKAAEATKEAASDASSKAAQGLSRVTSSAGPAIAGAARGVGNALSKVGGRTGRLVGFVESMWPSELRERGHC
jgi:F-type H+-transporting ATPase subunit g